MPSLISVGDAKGHLRLDSDHEDTYLEGLIVAVSEYVQDDLNIIYEDDEEIPAIIQHAAKFLLAHWFENREPVTISNGANAPRPIPLAYDSIIRKYRRYPFS